MAMDSMRMLWQKRDQEYAVYAVYDAATRRSRLQQMWRKSGSLLLR